MKDFIGLIEQAQNNDNDAMLEIIEAFSPLIAKYSSYMNYDEDFKSEMQLKLIEFILNEFKTENLRDKNNYVIVKYIQTVLHNHYILLSKANRKHNDNEVSYEHDILVDLSDSNDSLQDNTKDLLLHETLKSVLTDREYLCVDLIILQGYTAESVSDKLGISKQAVNQCKKRALKKLKKIYC